jgi:hypothetical protein
MYIRVEGILQPTNKTLWCIGNQTKTMSKMTLNTNQTKLITNLVYVEIQKIYEESYKERESKGEFVSAMEIDDLIGNDYYEKCIQKFGKCDYSQGELFKVVYSISAYWGDSSLDEHYEEFTMMYLDSETPISKREYIHILELILELSK